MSKTMSHYWRNKNVFVTGAGGFIGSHLTETLVKTGARVRAMVHYNSRSHWGFLEPWSAQTPSNLDVVSGDIRDAALMRHFIEKQDVVFHLAALIAIPYSYVAPQSFVETNVLGTLNILEAARLHKTKRVIHTSTSEVYGTARYTPMDEEHPLQGQSPYSASKIAADQLALSFYRSFELPVTVVRPFNTYGPRQSARAVIPTILSNLLSGQKTLTLGDTKPVRDFTYVTDTVQGFLAAAQSNTLGDVINIGSGRGWSIREIAQHCATLLHAGPLHFSVDKRRLRPTQSEVWKLICDNGKARRRMHWTPSVSLDMGLAEVTRYIRSHADQYKSARYNI